MSQKHWLVVLGIWVAMARIVWAAPSTNASPERMAWWNEQKFGLFIHWGNWSQTGIRAEWEITKKSLTPEQRRKYWDLYKTFNPAKYDPQQWAKLAKEAGMRYAVMTAKPHQGFCLWPTKTTDWCITNPACPCSELPDPDLVGRYVKAFREQGLAPGLYFSHIDWHDPDGQWYDRHRNGFIKEFKEKHPDRWADFVGREKEQVRELLTDYAIDILWFDIGWPKEYLSDAVPMLRMIRQLRPNILLSNRGTLDYGDFGTPEQHVPGKTLGKPWECCMTIVAGKGGFWYAGPNAEYKTTEELIHILCDVASKGGNLLLDVGPKGDGTIPEPYVRRLKGIGKWMRANGEAIYGTTASPLNRVPDWGRITRKGRKLYLIVFDWPQNKPLPLEIPHKITSTKLLATGATVPLKRSDDGKTVRFTLPPGPPTEHAAVIVVEVKGDPT